MADLRMRYYVEGREVTVDEYARWATGRADFRDAELVRLEEDQKQLLAEAGQLRAELQQAKRKANELWRAKVQGLAGCPYPEEWTP